MRLQKGIHDAALREQVKIAPEVALRMELESNPDAALVGCFVLTRGAHMAWAAINQCFSRNHDGFFWISGPGGTGKTHFLNYVMALSSPAGSVLGDVGRHLILPIEITGPAAASGLDRLIIDAVAKGLTEDTRPQLWQTTKGAGGVRLALESARRQGIKTITAVIDFGAVKYEPADDCLKSIAAMVPSLKGLKLIVIVAARGQPPDYASPFTVGPEDDELMPVAIGRARLIDDAAAQIVEDAYRAQNIGDNQARAIFPLHPEAVAALHALAASPDAVPMLARMVREVLLAWREAAGLRHIVLPAVMMNAESVRATVERKLGNIGCAALKAAYAVAEGMEEHQRAVSREVVDTLILQHIVGDGRSLTLEELNLRVPVMLAARTPDLRGLVDRLVRGSNGSIIFEATTECLRFSPQPVASPEVARFNLALPLICRFDSSMTPARELPELSSKFKRLAEAMGSALEAAYRNRDLLTKAMQEAGGRLSDQQQKVFADFIAIAENGPPTLVEMGADAERREVAFASLTSYEALAVLAGAVPRLRSMREYLDETGLHANLDHDPVRDRTLGELETACEVLRAAVNPAALTNASRNLDSLEARFQQFKWTYVQHYRTAHEAWRNETDRLRGIVDDTHLALDALRRLNSIAALGPAEGPDLVAQLAPLAQRVAHCDLEGPLSPEITPRCPRCSFVIGTPSPRDQLNDLAANAARALNSKLAVLSQSAIARLIEQHDHSHRLDGFLKIIQAAQTEALARVLDDKLARYLGHLLDENIAETRRVARGPRAVVQPLRTRLKRDAHSRADSRIKMPPSGDRR